jgi:hypothetical protein
MNAGLPGSGIGGLFYILLALGAPVRELALAVRGRRRHARWGIVARSVGMAAAIVLGVAAATLALAVTIPPNLKALAGGNATAAGRALLIALSIPPILACLMALVEVLAAAQLTGWARQRVRGVRPAFAAGALLVSALGAFALLGLGGSQPEQMNGKPPSREERTFRMPEQLAEASSSASQSPVDSPPALLSQAVFGTVSLSGQIPSSGMGSALAATGLDAVATSESNRPSDPGLLSAPGQARKTTPSYTDETGPGSSSAGSSPLTKPAPPDK